MPPPLALDWGQPQGGQLRGDRIHADIRIYKKVQVVRGDLSGGNLHIACSITIMRTQAAQMTGHVIHFSAHMIAVNFKI